MADANNREGFQNLLARHQSRPSGKVALSSANQFTFDHARYQRMIAEDYKRTTELKKQEQEAVIAQSIDIWKKKVGNRWSSACLDQIKNPDAHERLADRINRHVAKDPDGLNETSLLVSGLTGRGKTYLGYAYAFELIKLGLLLPHQIFIGSESVLSEIVSSGFRQSEKMEELLSSEYKFYMIDDVGRGRFKDISDRGTIWHQVLDHMYAHQIPIVLTTNLLAKKPENVPGKTHAVTIAEWLGDSAVDRLRHIVGNTGNIVMTGDDIRAQVGSNWEQNYRGRQ